MQPKHNQSTADKPVSQLATLQPTPQKVPRVQQVQSPRVKQNYIPSNHQYHNPFLNQPQTLPTLYPHTNFQQQALARLIAQQLHQPHAYMNHIYNKNTGKKETIDTLLAGENKQTWLKAVSNKFGQLTKGDKYNVKFTDTMEFISKEDVPIGKKVTYGSFTCDHRPLKEEEFRARLVVGGDKLTYFADASSPAASIIETKILVYSILSDHQKGARFMSVDLKDFFLQSNMTEPEYMRLPYKWFPQDIIQQYNLEEKVSKDGYIYIKIKCGMYRLRQATILAYKQLVKNLKPYGYYPIPHTMGMWAHKTRPTKFCLCVDDFGVKYFSKDDIHHLLDAL